MVVKEYLVYACMDVTVVSANEKKAELSDYNSSTKFVLGFRFESLVADRKLDGYF